MADDIIQFAPGGKVTAEETNENNLLLKEWALDNSQSQTYIDGKIATLTANLNSQISSLNSQIATKAPSSNPTLTGTVKVPNNAAVGTAIATAAISKSANGYLKMGNGIIIQWGASLTTNTTNPKITFPIAFSTTNYFAMAYGRGAKNWDHTWGFKNNPTKTTCNFYIDSGDAYQWIAIGY